MERQASAAPDDSDGSEWLQQEEDDDGDLKESSVTTDHHQQQQQQQQQGRQSTEALSPTPREKEPEQEEEKEEGQNSNGSRSKRQARENNNAPSEQEGESPPSSQFDYSGLQKQERRPDGGYDSEASYQAHGWELKRRKLLTVERKHTLLPADNYTKRAKKAKHNSSGKQENLKMVDFGQLAASDTTKWGTRVLFENLSREEIDALVGLATTWGSEEGESDSPLRTMAMPMDNDNADTATDTAFNAMSSAFADPQTQNPLLATATDPPLPPSVLKYIQSRSEQLLQRDNTTNAAVNGQSNDNTVNVHACFGASAAVSVGMAVEDAITASLLPLAGLHVLRCRAIEDMMVSEDDDEKGGTTSEPAYSKKRTTIHPITGEKVELDMEKIAWRTESPFQEWTLPPEEAIMKLLEQGLLHSSKKTVNNFVSDPCRQYCTKDTQQESNNQTKSLSELQRKISKLPLRERIKLFAKRHDVNANVIATNPDVFSVFMPPR